MTNIEKIQKFLNLPVTGIPDPFTNAALRNYQLRNALMVTGEPDNDTLESMGLLDLPQRYIEKLKEPNTMQPPTTDEKIQQGTQDTDQIRSVPINKHLLPYGQYLNGKTPKWSLFLHHTAGWENPYKQVDIWAQDTIGPIGTHYVIGGPNITNNDPKYDGEIVQCIPDENYAWHLTIGNTDVHRNSIGIEICNFGWLTKGGYKDKNGNWIGKEPNSFYTWFGIKVPTNQVIDLEFKFRDHRYFHKYTDHQLESLKFLIKFIGDKFGINIYNGIYNRLKKGMHPGKTFEYWEDARYGKVRGMFCHTNVVPSGKWDLSPQPNLIDMLLTL